MKLRVLTCVALLLSCALAVYSQNPPGGSARKEAKAAAPAELALHRALAETVEMSVIDVQVRELLDTLSEKVAAKGLRLDIAVDQEGIRLLAPEAPDFLDQSVTFRGPVRSMTVQQILDRLVAWSANTFEVTYLLRQGRVEIVPIEFAKLDYLMDRGVTIQFRETPVAQALAELSDASGVTIAVDPRCGEALTKPFTLRSGHDTSVRGVLECLADMYDLRLLMDEHRVFLTTETQYLKRLKSRIDEAKLRKELEPVGIPFGVAPSPEGLGGGPPPFGPALERPRQYGRGRNREPVGMQ